MLCTLSRAAKWTVMVVGWVYNKINLSKLAKLGEWLHNFQGVL